MVLGKGSVFSDRPLPFEKDRSDSRVVIENINADIPEKEKIGLFSIHSHLSVESQSCTHINWIKMVVQAGVGQHKRLPRLVFHGQSTPSLQEEAEI